MPVASVPNHGERHVNPFVEQQLERQSGTSASEKQNGRTGAIAEDTFTPSQDSSAQGAAQDAGIFQITQATPTVNAAPAQPASNSPQNPSTTQSAPQDTAAADTVQTNGAANSGAAANAAQQIAGAPSAATEEQGQVQALNTELAALGLSNYDILQIDRIATVIQNFNPSAYTDLVNQFEEQTQEAAQLASPPPATSASVATSPAAPENSNAGTSVNTNSGGLQVQSAPSSFANPQETANLVASHEGAQGAGPNSAPADASNLQTEQVQITLAGSNQPTNPG